MLTFAIIVIGITKPWDISIKNSEALSGVYEYRLKQTYQIIAVNISDFMVFDAGKPLSVTGYQSPIHYLGWDENYSTGDVSLYDISGERDIFGQEDILRFRFRREDAGGRFFNISVITRVKFHYPNTLNSSKVDELSAYEKSWYTSPEPLIESKDSLIYFKAQQIADKHESTFDKAQAINKWVFKNLKYAYSGGWRGARWAMKNRRGGCGESSCLFVAMCRAVGIPSRVVMGYVFKDFVNETYSSPVTGTSHGHAWAEFYDSDLGWVWVDPEWGNFMDMEQLHIATQRGHTYAPGSGPNLSYSLHGCDGEVRAFVEIELISHEGDEPR